MANYTDLKSFINYFLKTIDTSDEWVLTLTNLTTTLSEEDGRYYGVITVKVENDSAYAYITFNKVRTNICKDGGYMISNEDNSIMKFHPGFYMDDMQNWDILKPSIGDKFNAYGFTKKDNAVAMTLSEISEALGKKIILKEEETS